MAVFGIAHTGAPYITIIIIAAAICLAAFVPQARVNHPRPPNRVPPSTLDLTGAKPKEIKVETFRIDYLIRGPKVAKLSLQQIRNNRNPKPQTQIQNRKPKLQVRKAAMFHVLVWVPGTCTGCTSSGETKSYLY